MSERIETVIGLRVLEWLGISPSQVTTVDLHCKVGEASTLTLTRKLTSPPIGGPFPLPEVYKIVQVMPEAEV